MSAVADNAGHSFTPGPWKANRADHPTEWCIHAATSPYQLAYLRDDARAEWPLEANARLIAAAPELYGGCNALLGLIQLVLNRDDLTDDLRVALGNSHRLIEAKAALAKARGEAQ